MDPITKEAIIASYQQAYASIPPEALALDLQVTVKTIQALAEGEPVPPDKLAELWELPIEQVKTILEQTNASGQTQLDHQGHLVGGVLSLVPTNHLITFNDATLYAWCAFDAIFAPGVVAKTARVESRDPVTGEPIELTITPSGVQSIRPESAVISVINADVDLRGGPDTPRCTQQLFFASRASAERWLGDRLGVALLTAEEAFEVALEFQIEPARRLGLVQNNSTAG